MKASMYTCSRGLAKNTLNSILNSTRNENHYLRPPFLQQCRTLSLHHILRKEQDSKQNATRRPTPSDYYKYRLLELKDLKECGIKIHSNKFDVSDSLASVRANYSGLEDGAESQALVTVTGRVFSIRDAGKKLVFYDITEHGNKMQLVIREKRYKDVTELKPLRKCVKRNDFVGAKGYVIKTKSGELSVLVTELKILAPSLALLTDELDVLHLKASYVDLLVREDSHLKFKQRADIIHYIKRFLKERNFLEVKTPLLNDIPSGASAQPFSIVDRFGQDQFFRVAPELYLKMLVVGGLEKVFEIGPQFRNEAVDRTHFPTFTTCELYSTQLDYLDLLSMTETLLSQLVYKLFGSYVVKYSPGTESDKSYELNFEPPFARVDLWPALEQKLGSSLPHPSSLESSGSKEILQDVCVANGLEIDSATSTVKLIDRLCDKLLISSFTKPTFLMNHPLVMSPLAKAHRNACGLSERFELFAAQLELCNSYTELNDPKEQDIRFKCTVTMDDNLIPDERFVHALKHGLPPTAGWGMGIDRLVMLLTNCQSITQSILFPSLKPNPIAILTDIKPSSRTLPLHHQDQPDVRHTSVENSQYNFKLEGASKDYYTDRLKQRAHLEQKGFNLYPHNFEASHSIGNILQNYSNLKPGEVRPEMLSTSGRVNCILKDGDKFEVLLWSQDDELQVELSDEHYENKEEFSTLSKFIARGDYLGVKGHLMKTHAGDLSLQPKQLQMLAPCLVPLPTKTNASSDQYVDLMLNTGTRRRFAMIADVKDFLERFLLERDFQQVETPFLTCAQNNVTDSFQTHFQDFGTTLYVCSTPDLYLIRALVGGMSRVCELRTQFRNVHPTKTSCREFTTCQYFMVHADYNDVLRLAETMLSELVLKLAGCYKLKYGPIEGQRHEINFEPPFQIVDLTSSLESKLGQIPPLDALDTSDARDFFEDSCRQRGIAVQPGAPVRKLIAELCDQLIVAELTNPTFLMNPPLVLSPWAKGHSDRPGLAERFELCVAGMQLACGYTTLNDPIALETRSGSQIATDNGIAADEDYIHALRFGLPSAAGVTLGVDRLAVVLGNCQDINQVILFPKLNSQS